jgi:hypothetical protein
LSIDELHVAENISDAVRKIKMITIKPYGVNLWLGPREGKKDQDISSVQQFLDQKFRKPLGLPLESYHHYQNMTLRICHLNQNCLDNYK